MDDEVEEILRELEELPPGQQLVFVQEMIADLEKDAPDAYARGRGRSQKARFGRLRLGLWE